MHGPMNVKLNNVIRVLLIRKICLLKSVINVSAMMLCRERRSTVILIFNFGATRIRGAKFTPRPLHPRERTPIPFE